MKVLLLLSLAAVAEAHSLFKKPEDLLQKKPVEEIDDWQPESILTEEVPSKSMPYVVEDLTLDLTPEEMEASFIQMLGKNQRVDVNATKAAWSRASEQKAQTASKQVSSSQVSRAKRRAANDHSEASRVLACLMCTMRARDPYTCQSKADASGRHVWYAEPSPPGTGGSVEGVRARGSEASNEGMTPCPHVDR